MKLLSKYREDYDYFSMQAGIVARQSAYAGIAFIWLFSGGEGHEFHLPRSLLFPTGALIFALAFDLLHYIIASAIWGFYCRLKEKEFGTGNDESFDSPAWFNLPTLILFWGKLLAVILAYAFLLVHVYSSIKFV